MHRTTLAALLVASLMSCQTPGRMPQPVEQPEPSPSVSLEPAPAGAEGPPETVPRVTPPALPEEAEGALRSEDAVERLLARMTVDQKVGQRFISGISGTRLTERTRILIREGCLGGVLLSGQNIVSRAQVRRLTRELQKTSLAGSPPLGLLIAVDQEGGRVNRLDLASLTRFPAPFHWGEYRDPLYVAAAAYITAREALALGINMNLAPVLDLYGVADDSIIGDRSLGADPALVAEEGVYYLRGARRAGITAVAKHFPGHGRTTVDSHRTLPVVEDDEAALMASDLLPFRSAIESGLEAIMTAHILYPKLDPDYPVTLSPAIIHGLLRGELGFDGVVISDDIEMRALSERYSPREVVRLAFAAGVDVILLYGGLDTLRLIRETEEMVREGKIGTEELDAGTRRVLRLKARHGLLPASATEGKDEH